MKANEVVALKRRLSWAEAERLVSEFERSGLRRKEFCETHGLNVHTLDAWRKRITQPRTQEKIVPVEIVEDGARPRDAMRAANVERSARICVVLCQGLRIEVEPGFDAAELRRLIAALDSTLWRAGLAHAV